MRLQDKVCLITGGAAGIGLATARKFAEERATVVICDLDEEAGQKLVASLGGNAAFFTVNTTDRQAVQQWVDAVVDKYGHIDVLVNNAGITRDAWLVKVKDGELVNQMPLEEFSAVIDVNLKGVFNCTQAVAPVMIRQQSGVILNASSVVAQDGNFGQTNYAASKAGVIGMTRVWTRELGMHGIRVNVLAPGFITTEMTADMPDKILDAMRDHTPLNRLGKPSDIANAYAFLASDEAGFINGAVLRVDGGLVIGT
jgi:3-oxoacyl-[acyl-carrier protein] reductase